jgi:hypothetical protein
MTSAAEQYRAIVEAERLRETHTIVQVPRRRYSDERQVRWLNYDPDRMIWAREIACSRLPANRRGVIGYCANGAGHPTRLLFLREYDNPSSLADCPGEAVLLESVQVGVPSLSALPFLRLAAAGGAAAAQEAYREIAQQQTAAGGLCYR